MQCRIFDHHTGFLKYLLLSCSFRLKGHTHQEFTAKYSQNQKDVVVHRYFCVKLIQSKDFKIKMSPTPTLYTQSQLAEGQQTPAWLQVCCCGADLHNIQGTRRTLQTELGREITRRITFLHQDVVPKGPE